MAELIQIPVSSDVFHYQFRIKLDGVVYTLIFRFNRRMNRWLMDIGTQNEVMIIAGIPLLLGVNLIDRFQDARLPEGNLFLINIESPYQESGRDELGKSVLLLYQEAE